METKPNKMNLRELRAEFRAVSAENDHNHETMVARRGEIDALKKEVAESGARCMWTARNLVQERTDLQARIERINLRLVGLGYLNAAGFEEKPDA